MRDDPKRWLLAGAAVVGLTAYFLVNPPRFEHVAVLATLVGLLLASKTTRSLGVTLIPAAAFGLIYDMLQLFQARSYETVVIEPIWRVEAALFGWLGGASYPLGPLDVFREHNWSLVDAFGGVVYSIHMLPAFVFGLGVWWYAHRDRDEALRRRVARFWWGFLLLHVLAFSAHVLMPVAPPWYVSSHGFLAPTEPVVGNPAGLARVDALLGYGHFEGVYSNGKYVFGALPSLHVAVPTWVALRCERLWCKAGVWALTALMAFFAVYFAHHYIIDLAAGLGLAVLVHALISHTPVRSVPVLLDFHLRDAFGLAPERAAAEMRHG